MDVKRTYISFYVFLLFTFVLSGNKIFSQQTSARNHYFIQEYLLNPAFTGAKNYNPFYISYRRQFSGIQDSPEFFSASGYHILNNESNVAGSIYNLSQGGAFNQTVGQFNYSHDYHFSSWAHITIGAGLIMNQFSANYQGLSVVDANDPVLIAGNTQKTAFDGTLGIKYFLNRFKFGLSIDNMLQSQVSQESNNSFYNKLAREFRLITQYDFTIDSLLHIEPLIVYMYLPESKISQLDLSVLANYNNSYTLGLMYRSNSAFSLIGGLQYKNFYFLYSHEISTNGLSSAIGNSNEITAGYRFKLRPDKMFVDNDMDGVINKKDTCPNQFGPKRYDGCPLEEWAQIIAARVDTTIDSIAINDSLIFKFEKLTVDQLSMLKLYLVDDQGNTLYQAVKTNEGFLFNYLPSNDNYFFKLENLPDSLYFEALEIDVNFGNEVSKILTLLNKENKFYEYKKLNLNYHDGPKLLIINDEKQVLAVGIENGLVFKFDYLPEEGNYEYKLVDAESFTMPDDFTIKIDHNHQIKDLKLVFKELSLYDGQLPHFIDESELAIAFMESNLFLVDELGKYIYKAENIDGRFVFKYLPVGDKYIFKLEDFSENLELNEIEVIILDGENEYIISPKLNDENGYYEYEINNEEFQYAKLNGNLDDPKLLMLNDQNQVISIGVMEDGVFKFDYLPEGGDYHYLLLNSDSASMEQYLHIVEEYEAGKKKQLIYNKITSRYEFSGHLLDESALEELKMNMDLSEEDKTLVNALEVVSDEEGLTMDSGVGMNPFFTIQIGAFRTKMDEEVYKEIKKVFGDRFNMYYDDNLQMEKYTIGSFKTYQEAAVLNLKLMESQFSDCFVIGVKDNKAVPVSEIR